MTRVWNLVNDQNNAVSNQFLIESKNCIIFQSYSTPCAKYKDRKVYLNKDYFGKDFDCGSKTTNKHLYIFLRDNTPYFIKNKKELLLEIKQGNIKLVSEKYIRF